MRREGLARARGRRDEIALQAWQTAYLQRVDADKFPDIAEYLRKMRGEPKRQQTAEEQMAILDQWAARLNGAKE